ncbi:MAG: 3-methyl-2-oxobutanoate hydroxymethyltransferase [Candidatus Eremiobacteraeota bacterium]|nr:3-methyl-2-oxobutanoate hydroxymethyltransferase [Candidatus Eremiobacteraeota bacterium]
MPPVRRLTSAAIRARKGKRFPAMTAYDAPFARCVEEAGIDVILVGDSLGNVVLGLDSTAPVELADMCHHAAAVKRGTTRAHVIVDLPFGTYQVNDEDAVRAAIGLVKAGATSVKLEGGVQLASRIEAIVKAGIPVVAHIGVMPQTASGTAGFRRKTNLEGMLADARAVEAAGAFAVVLEMVDANVARQVTETLAIPTIGIGAGPFCDAQILVLHDALGLYPEAPPFAKRFAELATIATDALRTYAAEVRDGSFPPIPAPAGGPVVEETETSPYVVSTPS